ncbi:helix-turn-helix domain-containing protein [Streptomyces silaceus]|uniref:helix-turn-helix domain-containing protein n=1 Tax=Streptomyces silaceus TaxID=545123 RepID=UPI0006EB3FC2|nr:helix-turn-helix domain-containing protein [Streptomyces silaceus]
MGDAAAGRGARVRPEVVATAGNRIVAGRLAAGRTYRTVRHGGTEDWLLMFTCRGRGRIRSAGAADVHADGRSFVAIAPGTPHDYGTDAATGDWLLLWAHVRPRPEWPALPDWPRVAPGVGRVLLPDPLAERVTAALTRAVSLSNSALPNSALFGINAVEEALLWCDTQNPRGDRTDPRLLAVLEHLSDRLADPHTVRSLARVAGLSASRLSRLFRARFGTSVMAYVEERRMEVACRLLTLSSLTVREVARQVGYRDPLYFSTRFRRAVGHSPSAHREAGGD